MRQVPKNSKRTYQYLLIGNGKTARHISYYFDSLGHKIHRWHYKPAEGCLTGGCLKDLFERSDRCLLLIKDSVVEEFLQSHPFLRQKKTVHFSGSLEIEGVLNTHPLISFSNSLFPLEFYLKIPWAQFTNENTTLEDLLPGLPNASFYIPAQLKPLYHGLCVVSGNFTVHLWQLVLKLFKHEFQQSVNFLSPYLESIFFNMKKDWDKELEGTMTGPVARKDESTLIKNYEALKNTPLVSIFEAHVQIAWPEFVQRFFKNGKSKNEDYNKGQFGSTENRKVKCAPVTKKERK